MKKLTPLISMVLSLPSFASSYTIRSVTRYKMGTGHVMNVQLNESLASGCEVTDNQRRVSFISTQESSRQGKLMYNTASSALPLKKKVMLLLDSDCSPAYGLNISSAIEFLPE